MPFRKIPTSLQDLFIIESTIWKDLRGEFMELYSEKDFSELGISTTFLQDNYSMSKKWVLRWFHFQSKNPQAKLIHVIRGSLYDVVIDLRTYSPTYKKWEWFCLSDKEHLSLFVPAWFAHGFLALTDDVEILYKCDNVYSPEYEKWILWNDRDLSIDWKKYMTQFSIDDIIVSQKDKNNMSFSEYLSHPFF